MSAQAVLWLPAGGFEKQDCKTHIRALCPLDWPCQYLPVRLQRLQQHEDGACLPEGGRERQKPLSAVEVSMSTRQMWLTCLTLE